MLFLEWKRSRNASWLMDMIENWPSFIQLINLSGYVNLEGATWIYLFFEVIVISSKVDRSDRLKEEPHACVNWNDQWRELGIAIENKGIFKGVRDFRGFRYVDDHYSVSTGSECCWLVTVEVFWLEAISANRFWFYSNKMFWHIQPHQSVIRRSRDSR